MELTFLLPLCVYTWYECGYTSVQYTNHRTALVVSLDAHPSPWLWLLELLKCTEKLQPFYWGWFLRATSSLIPEGSALVFRYVFLFDSQTLWSVLYLWGFPSGTKSPWVDCGLCFPWVQNPSAASKSKQNTWKPSTQHAAVIPAHLTRMQEAGRLQAARPARAT